MGRFEESFPQPLVEVLEAVPQRGEAAMRVHPLAEIIQNPLRQLSHRIAIPVLCAGRKFGLLDRFHSGFLAATEMASPKIQLKRSTWLAPDLWMSPADKVGHDFGEGRSRSKPSGAIAPSSVVFTFSVTTVSKAASLCIFVQELVSA